MTMTAYKDMVKAKTEEFALDYLLQIASQSWPKPAPVLEWAKGEPKVRQPQNIQRKVLRILKAGKDFALKWKTINEGKEIVEESLGPLRAGELCDIPHEDTIFYSARDADATIRVYPTLWERIQSQGLEGTFWRDMEMLPMVIDMMKNGILIDQAKFAELSQYFQTKLNQIQGKIHNRWQP